MYGIVGNTVAWVAATGAALAMAVGAPTDNSVMGRVPHVQVTHLQKPVLLSQALPADRTLAIVAFHKSHAPDVEAWIEGLQLRRSPGIAWVRMPVLADPGDAASRTMVESRLLARFQGHNDHARLLPVFTDRAAFVRSAGLESVEQVYAIVLNRQGEVLARAGGPFDEDKAQALRETLLGI
ncbi:MAG: hypothetical protein ABW051_06225 [Burkholderiaceae bacterium]